MQADISKPSGAMVTVAAIPKTVVMDIASSMFTILMPDRNRDPLNSVKNMKHSTRVITAAQFSRNLAVLLLLNRISVPFI